jgi:hypothetical protein
LSFQAKKLRLREELIAELKNSVNPSRRTTEERVRIEAESYLAYSIADADLLSKYSQDPLLFWSEHGSSYPTLQQLAALFLGMSAGSVPVESLFSITGLICNSRRSSLSPAKLNKLCFLHDNLDFVMDACAR